jgi:hypothetical protein
MIVNVFKLIFYFTTNSVCEWRRQPLNAATHPPEPEPQAPVLVTGTQTRHEGFLHKSAPAMGDAIAESLQ